MPDDNLASRLRARLPGDQSLGGPQRWGRGILTALDARPEDRCARRAAVTMARDVRGNQGGTQASPYPRGRLHGLEGTIFLSFT